MQSNFFVLGIESSCDETAAAVLGANGVILAETVFSQQAEHAAFGGVVPEIAARAHLQRLPHLVADTMQKAGISHAALHAVAATSGPGLIGGLTVRLPGLMQEAPPDFPYLLMLLSGGHCQCVEVQGLGQYRRLGTTLDDAVGEAFDKSAKLLGLPWPGGPHLERLAAGGDAASVTLPRPLLGRPGCDFSFSGLKTAVARAVAAGLARPADIAAAFQASVAAVLADRASHALDMAPQATALVVAGGVAANTAIRTALRGIAEGRGLPMLAPPLRYCTDNAVMVAWAGIERLRLGLTDTLAHNPRPRWPL
jgi:N6-L-threonylcarbamoyladenine synthase